MLPRVGMRWIERALFVAIVAVAAVWVCRRTLQESMLRDAAQGGAAAAPDGRKAKQPITVELTEANLEQAMQMAGANPTKGEVRAHVSSLRGSGIAEISPAVLRKAMDHHRTMYPPERQEHEMEEAWSVVDRNGDGKIAGEEVDDLLQLVTTLGDTLTGAEAEDMIGHLDANEDGEISKEEFQALFGASLGGQENAASTLRRDGMRAG